LFAEAVEQTLAGMRQGIAEVRDMEGTRFISGVAAQVVHGTENDTLLLDPASSESAITPQDLTLIYATLAALDAYAELLQVASAGSATVDPRQYAQANAERFKYLEDAASEAIPEFGDFATDVVNLGAGSIQSLGGFLTAGDLKGDLPTIVQTMQPHISAIAHYFIERIGSPHPVKKSDGSTQAPHGWRSIVSPSRPVSGRVPPAETKRIALITSRTS
jgi:hypothetical protein